MNSIKKLSVLACLFLIQCLLSSCAVTVYSDSDQNINFRNYRTFAWNLKDHKFKNKQFDNQIVESNVKNLGSAELKKRGMVVNVDSPDVILDYEIMVTEKTEKESEPIYNQNTRIVNQYNPNNPNQYYHPYNYNYNNNNNYNNINNGYYNNNGYNNNGYNNTQTVISSTPYVVGYQTINVPYEEGTLTVVAVDRKTNRLIWKGWAVGTLTDEQTYESELHSDIKRIFKQFPLKPLKNQGKRYLPVPVN